MDQYYLRARYYDPATGRFTSMDPFQGLETEPVTFHKYLYANADPVNTVDPTGLFGLVEFGVANNIRITLSEVQVDVGLSLSDAASFGDDPNEWTARQTGTSVLIFLTAGGKGSKLLNRLLRKGKAVGLPPGVVSVLRNVHQPKKSRFPEIKGDESSAYTIFYKMGIGGKSAPVLSGRKAVARIEFTNGDSISLRFEQSLRTLERGNAVASIDLDVKGLSITKVKIVRELSK